jgi:imidazolonepropionase-like amidohydrolase
MVKAIWDAGGHVLLGSDTANPFLIPGFSIHGELAHLVEAGLTPYEALQTGTRNAAEFLGELREFGTITEGLRADLILLEDNPLDDVGYLRKRVGVMLRGDWHSNAELEERLRELAASYAEQ